MAASVNIKVNSDFDQAAADLKKFGNVSEAEAKKIRKFVDSFETEQIDRFIDRNKRSAAAVTATRGPLEGAKKEYFGLRREIERLINKGMDPQSDKIKRLTKDYQRLEKELEDVQKETKETGKSMNIMDGIMVGLGSSLVNVAQEGFRMFIDFSRESAEAASDAQEIFGKFSVVFREVEVSANSTANALAADFDLAGSTAQELLGNTGDLLTGFGLASDQALDLADTTNRLALDLASFTNAQGGAAAVSKALTSAYSGEREALKTYGIVINEAQVQSRILEQAQQGLTFESEQQAKIFATLSLAQEQSKNAIGDYARTADSAANVQRTLNEQLIRSKENWGALVLEGLTPVRRAFRDILTDINDLIEEKRNLDSVLAGEEGGDMTKALTEQRIKMQELEAALAAGGIEAQKFGAAYGVNSLRGLREFREEQLGILADLEEMVEAQDMSLLRRERSTTLAQEEADATEKTRIEQEALATLVEERYVSARKEVVSILESERTGLDKLEDKFNELSRTPWASGELEAQRLDALDILQARITELREAEQMEGVLAQVDLQSRLDQEQQIRDEAAGEQIIRNREFEKKVTEIKKRETEARIALTLAEFSATAGLFDAVSELIGESFGETRKVAIAQKALASASAGINSGVAFTKTLVDGGPFPLNVISAAAVLASGIAQQIKILGTPIPSAQTGGQFTVPETNRGRGDNIGVMAGAGETINVSPRGEGGRTQNISVSIAEQVIFDIVNNGIESADIRITADNIQQGASVA